ncbi:MAG: ribonuclease HII [Sphingomonadales bacterium]|jgi:ribonuclease HII
MEKTKIKPTFDLEKEHACPVAGIDEAGRGPLAGPVVAAAVILDPNAIPEGLNDSKKLTAKKREELFELITNQAQVGVGIIEAPHIDRINILQATYQAMINACANLTLQPGHCLIDGNRLPPLSIPATAIVKGDSKSLSIAAASIIAKVTRDKLMLELDALHPQYGWARNMGYGTKEHIEAIKLHGPTPYHRMSFAPLNTPHRS